MHQCRLVHSVLPSRIDRTLEPELTAEEAQELRRLAYFAGILKAERRAVEDRRRKEMLVPEIPWVAPPRLPESSKEKRRRELFEEWQVGRSYYLEAERLKKQKSLKEVYYV